jgi:hypothetical protein
MLMSDACLVSGCIAFAYGVYIVRNGVNDQLGRPLLLNWKFAL